MGRLLNVIMEFLISIVLLLPVAGLIWIGYDLYSDYGETGIYLFIIFIGLGLLLVVGSIVMAVKWLVPHWHLHKVADGIQRIGKGIENWGK